MPGVGIKCALEAPDREDGMRVLVERRWPPGFRKDAVSIDLWLKEAAPSDALRRWLAQDASRWPQFVQRYRAEVESRDGVVRLLQELARRGRLTLLHAARSARHSNAEALCAILEQVPTSSSTATTP